MKNLTARRHIEIYRDGECVRRSQNLRGLIAYGHRYKVRNVTINRKGDGATFAVEFGDGATCSSAFASWAVCADFFRSRRPKWGGIIWIDHV